MLTFSWLEQSVIPGLFSEKAKNFSHEIRTPQNSIIGFSELISDPVFDAERHKDFARIIYENGNNLLNTCSFLSGIPVLVFPKNITIIFLSGLGKSLLTKPERMEEMAWV